MGVSTCICVYVYNRVYEVIEFKKANESPEEWDYISGRLELIYTTYRSIY